MKKLVSVLCIIGIFSLLSGCAFFQKAKSDPIVASVQSYQLAGETIISSHAIAIKLRSLGKITDEQMVRYNELLNQTKVAYRLAGESLRLYINTNDAVKQKEALVIFQGLASEAGALAIQILIFVQEVSK